MGCSNTVLIAAMRSPQGESNTDEFGTAKWCVNTHVFGTALLQQHHLLRLDEIARLETLEEDA